MANPAAHTILLKYFIHPAGELPGDAGRTLAVKIDETIVRPMIGRTQAEIMPLGAQILTLSSGHKIWTHNGKIAAFNPGGVCIGGVVGGNIYVDKAARGRSLGPELMLAAWDEGLLTTSTGQSYSSAGHANRVRAHYIAVSRARAANLHVPPDVTAEFPKAHRERLGLLGVSPLRAPPPPPTRP